ncbi:MAG: class II aldolase/adducin family protein [Vicinamibacteria bacterium]
MSYDRERAAIIEVGLRLYQKGLVTATEGNISMRVADGHLVTSSGVSKGFLTPEHVILIDGEGHSPSGGPSVSSEDKMHAAIYQRRPEVQAVIHAHPPTATAFAVAHVPLDSRILAESVLVLGMVPLIPYATPGTQELANAVAGGLGGGYAALLANHGAVTVGKTLDQAHQRMETLEHVARVALMARLVGGARELSPSDVERLLGMTTGPYR